MQSPTFSDWFARISWLDQSLSLAINLIATLAAFLLGVFFSAIPKSQREYNARKFWGNRRVVISHGTLQMSPNFDSGAGPLLGKFYSDRSFRPVQGCPENLLADSELRSVSYLVAALSSVGTQWEVKTEEDALKVVDTDTMLVIGSPGSNEVTKFFLEMTSIVKFEESVGGQMQIMVGNPQTAFGTCVDPENDYAVIARITNPLAKGKHVFVCAGLGEWGTSGAAYYLWQHWQDLHREFQSDFAIVVRVKLRVDHSTARVFPKNDRTPPV